MRRAAYDDQGSHSSKIMRIRVPTVIKLMEIVSNWLFSRPGIGLVLVTCFVKCLDIGYIVFGLNLYCHSKRI